MYKYSMTQWITGRESIQKIAERLKSCGYDGIELTADPYGDVEETLRVLEEYDLPCSSLCGVFPPERDLSSKNREIRRNAVRYVKDSIDMAAAAGCSTLIVVPSSVGMTSPSHSWKDGWKYSKESFGEFLDHARYKNVNLAVEAVNRYETYLINTISMAKLFVEELRHPNIKLMADFFHMSIEERSMKEALWEARPYLIHVHMADNTREPAGKGQTDFRECYRILKDIQYKGYLTMEFLPRVSNPYLAQEGEGQEGLMDRYAKEALDFCRKIEQETE